MKSRLLSVVLVFTLLLATVPAVNAQGDDTYLTCYNLSAEDCTLLLEGMAASEAIQSFNMNFTMHLNLNGLGAMAAMMGAGADEAPGDIAIHVEGSGPFSLVETEALAPFMLDLAINAAMDAGTESQSGTINVRIVDDFVYFTDPETGAWQGIAMADAMKVGEEQMGLGGLLGGSGEMPSGELNPADLLGGDPNAMMQAAGLGEDAAALLQTPGFINHVRLPDQNGMNGFELTLDFAPLFASTDFQNLLNTAMSQAASAEDPSAAQAAMMVPMLLAGTTIKIVQTQWYNAADKFINSYGLNLAATLDLAALMGPSSSGSQTPQIPPIELLLDFVVTMDQINSAFEVVAPEGATILTAEDLSAGM